MSLVEPSCSSHKINFIEGRKFNEVDYKGVKFDIVGIGVIPRTYRLKLDNQSHELHLTVYFFFGIFKRRVDISNAKVNSNDRKAWLAVVSCETMSAHVASRAFFSDKSTALLHSLGETRKQKISEWVLVSKCDLKAVKTQVTKRVIPPKSLDGISVLPKRLKAMLHLIETSPKALAKHINLNLKENEEESINKNKEYQYFIWHYLSHSNGQYQHRLLQVCRLLCLCANIPELEQNKEMYKLLEHLPPVILKDVMLNWKTFKTTSSDSTPSENDFDSQTEASSDCQMQPAKNSEPIDSCSDADVQITDSTEATSPHIQIPESAVVVSTSSSYQAPLAETPSSNESEQSPIQPLEVIESMSSFNLMQTMLAGLLEDRTVKFCESLNQVKEDKETKALLELTCPITQIDDTKINAYFDKAWSLLLHTDNYQMNQCRLYFQSFIPPSDFSKRLIIHYDQMMKRLPEYLKPRIENTFIQILHYSRDEHQRALFRHLSNSPLKYGSELIEAYRLRYSLFQFERDDHRDKFVKIDISPPRPQISEDFDEIDDSEVSSTSEFELVECTDSDSETEQAIPDELLILGARYFETASEQDETYKESDDDQEYARISVSVKSSPEVARKTERAHSI